jgi:chromosome segregation protein
MKLDFIEVSGFRGFREKLRVDFGAGFAIICGRNGVGKSSLCDAIEFVLTGEIDKYRVEKSAQETLSDYVWWRGEGAPIGCYATLGFRGDDGSSFTVTRSRESGVDQPAAALEAKLCIGAKPDDALRQLCRTSIIRDEWIAALSLDLTETERFGLVRKALGAVEDPDYLAKATKVVDRTEATLRQLEDEYRDATIRHTTALAQLSEARESASNIGDVAAALTVIDKETEPGQSDLVERIANARSRLSSDRSRLNRVGEIISEGGRIASLRAEIESATFQQQKVATAQVVDRATQRHNSAQALLLQTRERLSTAQEADALAASLSLLIEHGERVGLDHDRCPLCDALRTEEEFREGLAHARTRLDALGSIVEAARHAFEAAEQEATASREALDSAESKLADLTSREQQLRQREAAYIALLAAIGLVEISLVREPDKLEAWFENERNRLIELERAILTLEASQSVQVISDLEERLATLRREVDAAADRVTRAQAAVSLAKNLERGVRRASAEIVDERLALISPLLSELYQRLRPHADWRTIEYSIRGDVRRFLSLKVGDGLNPQFVFSSGQRRAAGLAFLLSVHLSRSWVSLRTLILDDPIQHIDDFRALHLVEVMAALRQDGRQIICAVEDPALADLLCRRLLSTYDEPGLRYDLDQGPSAGIIIAQRSEIPPMPAGVLRQARPIQAAE